MAFIGVGVRENDPFLVEEERAAVKDVGDKEQDQQSEPDTAAEGFSQRIWGTDGHWVSVLGL